MPPPEFRSTQFSCLGRAFKWLGGIAGLLLVVAIVVHTIWSWRARSSFDQQVAALSAAGEPMNIAAIQPAIVPDEQNAYPLLMKAIEARPPRSDAFNKLEDLYSEPIVPLFDDERTLMTEALADHDATLALLDQSIDLPYCITDTKIASPMFNVTVQPLTHLRELTNLCTRRATLDLDAGQHDRALRRLLPIEQIARGAGSNPSLVGALVAFGCRAAAADRIMHFASTLKIGDQPGDAAPALVRKWIDLLLTDTRLHDELKYAYRCERVMQIDTLECLAAGTLAASNITGPGGTPRAGGAVRAWAIRPLMLSNAQDCLNAMAIMISATDAPNQPAASALVKPLEQQLDSRRNNPLHVFSSIMLPSLSRSLVTYHRVRTDRQFAAIALALRWYQCDHNGAYPSTLSELVPKYLPAVPMDPFASNAPIQYRAGEDPIIWSVDENGVNDNGSEESPNPRRQGPQARWNAKDAVLHLKPASRGQSALTEDPNK